MPPEDTYWSPYSGLDALCGNPLMIDLDDLVVRGLLDKKDLPEKVREVPIATTGDWEQCRAGLLCLKQHSVRCS